MVMGREFQGVWCVVLSDRLRRWRDSEGVGGDGA